MSVQADFLTALAQALSTMTLYRDGHPARERAVDRAHNQLALLQEEAPKSDFTFLGNEIIVNRRPLRELKTWDWSSRFSSAGIQRLELLGPVTRDELDGFLDEVLQRLTQGFIDTAEKRQMKATNIRYGSVTMKDGSPGNGGGEKMATATLAYTLREEADTVRWLHEELQNEKDLHLVEAEAIVRSLSVAMHGDQAFLIPLLRLKQFDQYTTTHALNVSILTMALAEFIGLGPKEVRHFGIAGLLHDLGKVKIPEEILNKPGKLTEQERLIMNSHTVEGARLILAAEDHLDLAAVVAYEHHIKLNGGGYPSFDFPRKCHQASDLVHVCDVFDALRTDRPYRDAWPNDRILEMIGTRSGQEFDPDIALAFVRMIGQWETRIAELKDEDEPLPLTEDENREGAFRVEDLDWETLGSPSGPIHLDIEDDEVSFEVVETTSAMAADDASLEKLGITLDLDEGEVAFEAFDPVREAGEIASGDGGLSPGEHPGGADWAEILDEAPEDDDMEWE